jgi:hypothetical protein
MDSESPERHPIDDLVRDYLEQQAEQEDTAALTARVLASISDQDRIVGEVQSPTPALRVRPFARRFMKPAAYVAATAAALWIAFVVGRMDTTAYANATTLVRAAILTHSEPIERCYVVTVEREHEDRLEFTPPRDVRLWTQGDRFWVEVDRGEHRWAWGRNVDGAVWATLGPRRAVQIEPDELGRPLQYMTDLYALELESLLQTILHRYRLECTSSTTTTHVITARPRGQRERWIREAVIEVDKETKAVRQLVLNRQLPERGVSVLTFTLVDARASDESEYHPEGHLTEPARIVASDVSVERRRELLVARFGPAAKRWIASLSDDAAVESDGESAP